MNKPITLVLLALLWPPLIGSEPAGAAAALKVHALISPNGMGRVFANHGEAPWTWEACARDRSSCTPFGNGREIKTGGAPAGTVFKVRSQGRTGFSPEWRGRLTLVDGPSLDGVSRANGFVSPMPARWDGGWKSEFSELQLSACATATGQNCITLTDPRYPRSCADDASFALDEKFIGTYLRVANRRVGAGPPARTAIAVSNPYGGEVWATSRNTAVFIAGQIAAPISAYPGECGPPPPGTAVIDADGSALVDCQGGCRATLVISRRGRQIRVTQDLPSRDALLVTPPVELRVSNRTIQAKLGPGRVRFAVNIDGKQVAQRTAP